MNKKYLESSKTYSCKRGLKILLPIFVIPIVIFFSWLMYILSLSISDSFFLVSIVLLTLVFLILLMILGLISVFVDTVSITKSKIVHRSLFSLDELSFDDIKGYNKGEHLLFRDQQSIFLIYVTFYELVPKKKSKKSIKVTPVFFVEKQRMVSFIENNFKFLKEL